MEGRNEANRGRDGGPPAAPDVGDVDQVLDRSLDWARARRYAGYARFDALESGVVRALLGWSRPTRLLAGELVLRSPVNVRGLLGIPRRRSPEGSALFAGAYLFRYDLGGDPTDRSEAASLLDDLWAGGSRSHGGLAWGYQHRLQDDGFYAPAGLPNRVVTSCVAEALLHGHRVLGGGPYLEASVQAAEFLLDAPRLLYDDGRSMCLSSVPIPGTRWRSMDVPAVTARVLSQVASLAGLPRYREAAGKLLRFVVERQTPEGGWYPSDPPSLSGVRQGDAHLGSILDSLRVYAEESGSDEFLAAYEKGLRFYRENLFDPDGAPRFSSEKAHPRDARAAAQGIITLERAGGGDPQNRDLADRILAWTLGNLWQAKEGRFFEEKCRFHTKRITLLPWSQGGMSFALAFRQSRRRIPAPAPAPALRQAIEEPQT